MKHSTSRHGGLGGRLSPCWAASAFCGAGDELNPIESGCQGMVNSFDRQRIASRSPSSRAAGSWHGFCARGAAAGRDHRCPPPASSWRQLGPSPPAGWMFTMFGQSASRKGNGVLDGRSGLWTGMPDVVGRCFHGTGQTNDPCKVLFRVCTAPPCLPGTSTESLDQEHPS